MEPGPVLETSFGANTGTTRAVAAGRVRARTSRCCEPYLDWVARTAYPGAQTATELAAVVLRALTEAAPPLRIPSSEWARTYAGIKLADADGTIVQAMTRSWLAPQHPIG